MSTNNFLCETCNQSFSSIKGLNIHVIRIHKPEAVLECPNCHKKFEQPYYVKRHLVRCIERTKFVKEATNKEIKELKTEFLKQEIEHQKEINQLLRKTIEIKQTNKLEEKQETDKHEHKLFKLYSILEESLINKPHEILLQNPSGIAQWFFRSLEKYGMSKVKYGNIHLVILIDDEIKPIVISKDDLFTILRSSLKYMKICFNSVVSICLGSTILPTIEKQILSVNDAKENFKNLKAWIKEENTENFEKSFYHFFNILVESELRQ